MRLFTAIAIISIAVPAAAQQVDPQRLDVTLRTLVAQRDASMGQAQLCAMDTAALQQTLRALDAEQDADQDAEPDAPATEE